MPLTFANLGEDKVITSFQGQEELKRHLCDIGFNKGESIQLLSENESGFIVLVKGTRVAINKGIASKIMVN